MARKIFLLVFVCLLFPSATIHSMEERPVSPGVAKFFGHRKLLRSFGFEENIVKEQRESEMLVLPTQANGRHRVLVVLGFVAGLLCSFPGALLEFVEEGCYIRDHDIH